jgi:lactoylglutathione lyase
VSDVADAADAADAVVNHVGQVVVDLDRARRFYEEALGFEVWRELKVPDKAAASLLEVEPPLNLTALYLRLGTFVLELMVYERPGNPPAVERVMNEPGLTHLSISVEDVDATIARVESLGGAFVTRTPHASFVRDPDGQLVELLPLDYRRHLPP